jgi:hypothetical protein
MYYSLVFASIPRVHLGCVAFIAAAAVLFAQVLSSFLLPLTAVHHAYTSSLPPQGYSAGFAHVTPMQMKSTSAAWELLVCIGIGLLISGISDGLSNFFVVVTCIAVAVSWLTFSNVPAGLLFLLLYLFLLMVSFVPLQARAPFFRFKFILSRV